MQLNSKITEANWNNDDGCWNLTIRNPKTGAMRKDWAHVFINGTGEIGSRYLAIMEADDVHRHPE